MSFTGNGITNCYPDEVDNFVSITVLSAFTEVVVCFSIIVPASITIDRNYMALESNGAGSS